MIPDVPKDRLFEAMARFDREERNLPEWQDWEQNQAYKYAIEHEGRRYPVKQVIRAATGFTDFSGGPEANSYVEKRGLKIVPLREGDGGAERLQAGLEAVLSGYVTARTREPFGGQSEMYRLFGRLEDAFRKTEAVRKRPSVVVTASPGQGNWAKVPWIAFLDTRETATTQKGVYCVYLFREDMTGVHLTFNQGVTEPLQRLKSVAGTTFLKENARRLREEFPELRSLGLTPDDDIDLRAERGLGAQYGVSTIAYKFYEAGNVPADDSLLADLDNLLEVYERYVERKAPADQVGAWIFQANETYFDLPAAARELKEMTWLVKQHGERIRAGDRVFLWRSGEDAGIVAVATVLTNPEPMVQSKDEERFNLSPGKLEGPQPRVRLRIDRVLPERVKRSAMLGHPVLGSLTILTAPQGTNFRLTKEQADALFRIVDSAGRPPPPPATKDLKAACEAFSIALRQCNVSFGVRHDEVVRSFVASLATKRFAILTGLSGSGKTQLALRFGEWLGAGQSLPIPVRPDWTGAEALFGFEDGLQPPVDGRRAWYVPSALEFMLKAARDSDRPYLLLLDEMNLAHVERYFADVLSGMESEYPCLPNVQKEGDGQWRPVAGEPPTLPVPKNLLVVGTVNVDETTYMFSPKVLDRANTFEFRVDTADLSVDFRKPVPCAPGDPELAAGFLAIATDDGWHLEHRAPGLESFVGHLRELHSLLGEGGFEFGHRVFYEAIRFAAMLAAAGDPNPEHALDFQVLQKVLPRLHGSRRRVEPLLCALGRFCGDLGYEPGSVHAELTTRFDPLVLYEGQPRLPRSFDKVRRMTRNVRANQFTSFTE